jgi:hypothetical protein
MVRSVGGSSHHTPRLEQVWAELIAQQLSSSPKTQQGLGRAASLSCSVCAFGKAGRPGWCGVVFGKDPVGPRGPHPGDPEGFHGPGAAVTRSPGPEVQAGQETPPQPPSHPGRERWCSWAPLTTLGPSPFHVTTRGFPGRRTGASIPRMLGKNQLYEGMRQAQRLRCLVFAAA